MSLFGLVPNEMTHSHTIDKKSVIEAAAAAGLTLAAIAGLYKVLNKKVVDPMIGISEQPEQLAQVPQSNSITISSNLPMEFSQTSAVGKIASILYKKAATTVTDIPGVGQYTEDISIETDPLVAARINAIPALLGNLGASSVAGTTSPIKALLSTLAGATAGAKTMEYTNPLVLKGGLGPLANLAASILAAGGAGYATRRALDRFRSSNPKDSSSKYLR